MARGILIKTDKNGTKYYADYTCQRCGGIGGSDKWAYTGWTCYECGGSGKAVKPDIYKEYTPEYSAKLQAQREKRAEKRRAAKVAEFNEHRAEHIAAQGFNADGKCFVVVGNTYEIKDELREAGAKWHATVYGWVFTEKPERYNTVELTADECLVFHEDAGWCGWSNEVDFTALIASKLPKEDKPVSEYVGNVGDKLSTTATLEHTFWYERQAFRGWGTETVKIYKFRDANGNILVWNTTGYLDIEDGAQIQLTGTVKEHSEYKGEKQTTLQRCKVS
jgi:hypothetical protein